MELRLNLCKTTSCLRRTRLGTVLTVAACQDALPPAQHQGASHGAAPESVQHT